MMLMLMLSTMLLAMSMLMLIADFDGHADIFADAFVLVVGTVHPWLCTASNFSHNTVAL